MDTTIDFADLAVGGVSLLKNSGKIAGLTDEAVQCADELVEGAGNVAELAQKLSLRPDDPVYGPSAENKLRGLQKSIGGRTLNDIPIPDAMPIIDLSKSALDSAARNGDRILFDLTHMKDLPGVLSNTGEFAGKTTSQELRYIRDHYSRFESAVTFVNHCRVVEAPF